MFLLYKLCGVNVSVVKFFGICRRSLVQKVSGVNRFWYIYKAPWCERL